MMLDIDNLRTLCQNNAIRWTDHAAQRMLRRGITRSQVLQVIVSGEIIEQYPDDYPFPSCLLTGYTISGKPLHVVCGQSPDEIWIITAYYPDTDEWENDWKTRRRVSK